MLPVPAAIFDDIPKNAQCSASPFAAGAPIKTPDGPGPTITSIVELRNASGELVGWLYLAESDKEYVQGSHAMRAVDLRTLRLDREGSESSTAAQLTTVLPNGLRAAPCAQLEQKITD